MFPERVRAGLERGALGLIAKNRPGACVPARFDQRDDVAFERAVELGLDDFLFHRRVMLGRSIMSSSKT